MEEEEARKALELARKHDLGGNTEGALKWVRKSVSIHTTTEATLLLSRLQKDGAQGGGGGAADASPSSGPSVDTMYRNTTTRTTVSDSDGNHKEYTQKQVEIVRRVKRAGSDFYAVLELEKSASDGDVKKSYKKVRLRVHAGSQELALQLHPDKNRAPGADEAFKTVSKAFTVLSDKDKRAAFDRFGGDPDSRFGSAAAGAAQNPFAGFGPSARMNPGMGQEINPEDLFNMFFGGGMSSGFGRGPAFTFGGPGFRTQYYRPQGGAAFRGARGAGNRQGTTENQTGAWFQVLPIVILLIFSLLSYLPALFSTADPDFRWQPTSVHRTQRTTMDRGVSYYVDPTAWARHPFVAQVPGKNRANSILQKMPEIISFERRVEEAWMKELYRQCENAHEYRRRRLLDAQGFFGFGGDRAKITKIQSEVYSSCEQLKRLYHIRV
ncbi:Chaperone protein dnaJ [Malassezia sp. CBS 17886]|nr:Chaperone protein dnaJ [Malassezia sp. CBS 17886]